MFIFLAAALVLTSVGIVYKKNSFRQSQLIYKEFNSIKNFIKKNQSISFADFYTFLTSFVHPDRIILNESKGRKSLLMFFPTTEKKKLIKFTIIFNDGKYKNFETKRIIASISSNCKQKVIIPKITDLIKGDFIDLKDL